MRIIVCIVCRFLLVAFRNARGTFATGPVNVSGTIGQLVDIGLPTETNVVGAAINGVPVTLEDDGNGGYTFTSTNAVNGNPQQRVWAVVLAIAIADGRTNELPLGFVEGYEVITKEMAWDINTDDWEGYYSHTEGQTTYSFQPWSANASNEWFHSSFEGDGVTNTLEDARQVWQPVCDCYPLEWSPFGSGGWEPGGAVPPSGRGLGLVRLRCRTGAMGTKTGGENGSTRAKAH